MIRNAVCGLAAASTAMLVIRFFPQDVLLFAIGFAAAALLVVLVALNVGPAGRFARRNVCR